MADEPAEVPDADDVDLAAAPGSNQKHPSQDLLGILPGGDGREESPGKPLIEGERDFKKWAPRGIRSQNVAHAEVGLQQENLVLASTLIRGTTMKQIQEGGHIRTMFRGNGREFNKLEFGVLAMMYGALLFIAFLLFTTIDPALPTAALLMEYVNGVWVLAA